MALRGEAVGGQGGRRGSRRRLPGSVLEGLRLPPPKELGWRKVGCLWRPRGFTSSSWMKPSVGFVHDFRRSLVSTIHDVDLIVCLPALYNSSKRPTIHFTSRLSCSSRPSYLTVTRTRRFCSDPPAAPGAAPRSRNPGRRWRLQLASASARPAAELLEGPGPAPAPRCALSPNTQGTSYGSWPFLASFKLQIQFLTLIKGYSNFLFLFFLCQFK